MHKGVKPNSVSKLNYEMVKPSRDCDGCASQFQLVVSQFHQAGLFKNREFY